MRLNRHLSSCGLGSRRGCEQLIRDGRVILNGKICTNLSTTVTDSDDVVVDGNKVRPHKGVVIVLHKPRGLVCSRRDERDRDTIYNLLPEKFHTLHHVGRLDKESEGLLLMTNRGEVSQRLLHPSQGVEKEYEVITETRFDPEHLTRLTKGFHTEDGYAKAERAWMIGDYKIGMVLKQGLKRQIRMMLYFLGYEVKRLIRVRIGNLAIKGILEGNWKELSDKDVDKMLLNPLSKDRPKMSKPKTAAVRKNLENYRQKQAKRSSRKTGARKRTGGTSPAPDSGATSGSYSGERGPRGGEGATRGPRGGRTSTRGRDHDSDSGPKGSSSPKSGSGPRGGRSPRAGSDADSSGRGGKSGGTGPTGRRRSPRRDA
ncbi:pseudouridine synthase [Verrucomicrobium sp. BvORR106]|uniref:pseudouridine synthase n=1 Tax=Verrucomicrobium sp. BvORR106 TaxID=1403819 RepID=UPI0009DF2F5F|nr:pseudouridine synthase [Verrucomicrobium sp. BvORR106]